MATGNRPDEATTIDEKIVHPLEKLRSSIRYYALMDGLLTAGLFLVLWFWLGLALDFGLFKLTTFDWVLDAPRLLRTVALVVLSLTFVIIIVSQLAVKLTKTFSYSSLALVLEKRHPELLGDRLITAVELADVGQARDHGFSADMVRQTIADARERVDKVPVEDVFNWDRLRVKGYLLAAKIFGTFVLVFGIYALWTQSPSVRGFSSSFGDVSLTWAERNLLLQNVAWPRRAHLELVEFPESGDLRVGNDAAAPRVKVRAVQWVIADRSSEYPYGWRPLRWNDLNDRFLGIKQPDLATVTANDGTALPADANTWEFDRLQWHASQHPDMTKVIERLDLLAARSSMRRTLRKLTIPTDVTLRYLGAKSQGTLTLTAEGVNEFSGEVAGLKESVRFTVRGEDFVSLPRSITLVPPPMLNRLYRREQQPAYLYHPPPIGEDFPSLAGLRQLMADKDLSLTGDKSVFSVIQGTDLVITGQTDKPLSRVELHPKIGDPAKYLRLPDAQAQNTPEAPNPVLLPVTGDNREQFAVNLTTAGAAGTNLEFELVLVDDDQVTSRRTIVIQVTDDQPPQVEMAVDVLRKQGNNYLVTPVVRVPFIADSRVRDDIGLSRVEYILSYSQIESQFFVSVQAQALAAVFSGAPGQPSVSSLMTPAITTLLAQRLVRKEQAQSRTLLVGRFVEALQSLGADTRELLQQKLTQPLPADQARVVKEVRFQNPQVDYFDLREAVPGLGTPDESGILPRYRMELNVRATDVNVETGPKTSVNLETIRLLVISEADLLMEISKDEEILIGRVDEAIKKLRDAQVKLSQTADRLFSPMPPDDLIISSAVRAKDIAQDIAKSRDVMQGCLTDYRRLYREAEVNRCSETLLKRYQFDIIDPIQGVLNDAFVQSEQAHAQFLRELEAGNRPGDGLTNDDRALLAELIRQMVVIREKLGEVLSINKLRDQAQQILNTQKELGQSIQRLYAAAQERLNVPILEAIAPVMMKPGETKTIRILLDWGTFSEDDYRVKFMIPAASGFKVPAEFKVPDDLDEVVVELTAGSEPGEYPLQVIPSLGEPVTVMIQVKK